MPLSNQSISNELTNSNNETPLSNDAEINTNSNIVVHKNNQLSIVDTPSIQNAVYKLAEGTTIVSSICYTSFLAGYTGYVTIAPTMAQILVDAALADAVTSIMALASTSTSISTAASITGLTSSAATCVASLAITHPLIAIAVIGTGSYAFFGTSCQTLLGQEPLTKALRNFKTGTQDLYSILQEAIQDLESGKIFADLLTKQISSLTPEQVKQIGDHLNQESMAAMQISSIEEIEDEFFMIEESDYNEQEEKNSEIRSDIISIAELREEEFFIIDADKNNQSINNDDSGEASQMSSDIFFINTSIEDEFIILDEEDNSKLIGNTDLTN